jgi:uncharacterized membrane protein YgcG
MDPGTSYNQYAGDPADESDDQPTADNDPAPSDLAPSEAAPAPMAAAPQPVDPASAPESGAPDEDVAEAAPTPEAPADPTAGVTDAEIDATLSSYGQWVDTDDYGQVWRPDATVVGVDFTPYESGGSWQDTDAGWAFACDYQWGWLPFHYGRWAWFHDYWGWVPGHRWGPAWVNWRHGGGIVGWRPMRPQIRDHRTGAPGHDHRFGSGPQIRDHRHAEQHDAHWRFATTSDFGRPHVRAHLYGNLAEGLRVTSTVAAPPVRARTTVRAADLMRGRFASGGRLAQPGGGAPQVRDHRLPPPARYEPYNAPIRTHQPPVRGENPSVRSYQPPAQTYQPPTRGYTAPTRAYQPPTRTYQPPTRTYQPPTRTYQPPTRTYQPPTRTYQPPTRSYRPPAPTYQPPARSYSPPSHSSSPPSHSSSSPSHSSGSSSGSSSSHSSSSSSSSSHSSGSSSHSSSGGGHHR